MINAIIGVSALLIGGMLGFVTGYAKAIFGFLSIMSISKNNLPSLKKDISELADRIRNTKPQTEEEKELLRKEVFDVFTKYSKYGLHDSECVTETVE